MTKLITVYARLDDVVGALETDDVFREVYNRTEALSLEFAKIAGYDPDKAERLIMAFSSILEPNGYKIIKEGV